MEKHFSKDLVVLKLICIELLVFVFFVIETGKTTTVVACIITFEVADTEVRDFIVTQIA